MYIRFVVQKIDEDSGKRLGIFQVLSELRDQGELFSHEVEQMKYIHDWFNSNLKKPKKFKRSRNPNAQNKAISWFKD